MRAIIQARQRLGRWFCGVWLSAGLLFGCTPSQRVFPLSGQTQSVTPVPVDINGYPEAIAAIVSIVGGMGLPAPDGNATLYTNAIELESALLSEFHRDAELIETLLDASAREKF